MSHESRSVEVATETQRWSNFVAYTITNRMICTRDVLKVLKLRLPMARTLLTTFNAPIVSINHEMYWPSYV